MVIEQGYRQLWFFFSFHIGHHWKPPPKMTVFKNYYYFYYFTNLVIQDCHFLWLLDARNMPKKHKKALWKYYKIQNKMSKEAKKSRQSEHVLLIIWSPLKIYTYMMLIQWNSCIWTVDWNKFLILTKNCKDHILKNKQYYCICCSLQLTSFSSFSSYFLNKDLLNTVHYAISIFSLGNLWPLIWWMEFATLQKSTSTT